MQLATRARPSFMPAECWLGMAFYLLALIIWLATNSAIGFVYSNGDGEADLPGADQRLAEVQQLTVPAWSDAIADLASRNHWTHFLVHKNWPLPAAMPLKLVFKNDQYAVNTF